MRRTRGRGALHGEFGGSGEDSFVAVVVTKLTGALLFILLLTMVIMALTPRGSDAPASPSPSDRPLTIRTPPTLPEAIVDRPYAVALAAEGGTGPLRWSVAGDLPEGLTVDPEAGLIRGTPKKAGPIAVRLAVTDGRDRAEAAAQLVVFKPDAPLTLPSRAWTPKIPPIPWRLWLEHGFGFLLLVLVHMTGMHTLDHLQRWSIARGSTDSPPRPLLRRFFAYRTALRMTSLMAAITLAAWLGGHMVLG